MSRFFSSRHTGLTAYTPGEQPKDMAYIKLNTNESPYPPSDAVSRAAYDEAARCRLYSDPTVSALRERIAALYGTEPDNVLVTNGSDEILEFAFLAFGDEKHPFAYADITYGFYPVFSNLFHIPSKIIPLKSDFSIDVNDYIGIGCNIVIANPNAPTGLILPVDKLECIVRSNPDNIVIIDEAYVDFGGESCVGLTKKYDNLIVTQTFSKSRSLAGARLGFAVADKSLIADMNTVKYSTNPYNINRMSESVGCAALDDNGYYMENCRKIIDTREKTAAQLIAMGFEVLPSSANFIFAKSDKISGQALYEQLKAAGILVRHFTSQRIAEYNRITIGTPEQMDSFINTVAGILRKV